jgi:hypothetical protein
VFGEHIHEEESMGHVRVCHYSSGEANPDRESGQIGNPGSLAEPWPPPNR